MAGLRQQRIKNCGSQEPWAAADSSSGKALFRKTKNGTSIVEPV
jgi:hypothetical protein